MCNLLYDERVQTWNRMREIDLLIDNQPDLSFDMVKLDIRNRLAHEELEAYHTHRVFVYKHPIAIQKKQYDDNLCELYNMKRDDPGALMNEITNLVQNIRRIQSNLNKKKYRSPQEAESWKQNLARAKIRQQVLEEVIRK